MKFEQIRNATIVLEYADLIYNSGSIQAELTARLFYEKIFRINSLNSKENILESIVYAHFL